ncbi:hypothetical protein A3I99_03475 [Candidatus Kaiserbacteria bacterium RIFCSPLOWO2_02_FULL_45_11b]|uniref:Uncharacterized protein n=1 Tax=Candidatus Kaiserbacteria bacterium RIFCSPLOWO2_12_FULL_45_26 TaxID=1798525 RepID=A0A1F6FH21_9BACT|nr:MAG: hypothetical protein A2Z56_02690 [Candidatus Kaiserbacteria bacterium RIFCSPHIGHO2_12_45_16]OGG69986.1 MAG: hypothetical protein A2929_02350 [Candidatus Kaiserbacteria bacterium RIFCSPLOWO2_01_FULL_45_25]OGG83655.1 MAG: hypothetical protein A3I99_03475 [Candidatus Kaiserbacteria bacterium RIFCSPLOWO2_02_FULL_45_11b]OGG85146.1 MAG: hypothetical protein A3G90_03760 [Candidatus Kaiserbacteria bacterium RIFCSPLOWO2_12_FULL_45_26]
MFGFEKRFGSKKADETAVQPVEESVGAAEDYNVDAGRRNFLRQGVAVAATAGMAAVGMTPESAEAAGKKPKIELSRNINLTEYDKAALGAKLASIVPKVRMVQIDLEHSEVKEYGVNEKLTAVIMRVLNDDGREFVTKGVGFGTVTDQAGVRKLLNFALEDLKEKVSE